MKIYASFITYHPDPDRFKLAYDSIAPQVDKVIVIDNTLNNQGIANALNKAFEQAEREGCEWLITFDQDSISPEGLVNKLQEDIKSLKNVGQIGPAYSGMKVNDTDIIEKDHIITSGSLTSVSAWRAIGGFKNEMFIDYVDVEFSYRLRKFGYSVYMDTAITMDHQLGNGLEGYVIFGKKRLGFIDHCPVRWYYITRNCLDFYNEYKRDFPESKRYIKDMTKRIIRMIINGKSRAARIQMVIRGWKDYKSGVMGEYTDQSNE